VNSVGSCYKPVRKRVTRVAVLDNLRDARNSPVWLFHTVFGQTQENYCDRHLSCHRVGNQSYGRGWRRCGTGSIVISPAVTGMVCRASRAPSFSAASTAVADPLDGRCTGNRTHPRRANTRRLPPLTQHRHQAHVISTVPPPCDRRSLAVTFCSGYARAPRRERVGERGVAPRDS